MQQDAPAQPPPRETPFSRLPRWLLGVFAVCAASVVGGIVALGHQPDFYRAAVAAADPATAETLARRLVSKASALHAAIGRVGPWDAVISDDEINAWLAVDLPRNHGRLLPAGIAAPRVEIAPHHARVAARVGRWPLAAVASLDLEVRLRSANQVGIAVDDARLGILPLPRAAILRELGRRLTAAGLVTTLRRLDDRPLLLVAAPSAYDGRGGSRLETLALADGEVLVAGVTSSGGSGGDTR